MLPNPMMKQDRSCRVWLGSVQMNDKEEMWPLESYDSFKVNEWGITHVMQPNSESGERRTKDR